MAREPAAWAGLEVGDDVGLLLGWRPRPDHVDGRPVEIAADVRTLLRETAQETVAELGRRRARPLVGVPALEADEYLTVDPARLAPPTPDADGSDPASKGDEAGVTDVATDLLRLIEAARRDPRYLAKAEIENGRFLFYAVTATLPDGEPAAFVRQWNPKRGLDTGHFWTAYGNTLSRITDPVLIFDRGAVDMVVTADEVAVLRLTAFNRLFADLDLAVAQVPASLEQVARALPVELPAEARDVIADASRERRSLANQLRRLATADHLPLVTPEAMREALVKHGLAADRFGTGPALRLADADDVPPLLDLLEQLYFEADFTGEHRRADRYSRRP